MVDRLDGLVPEMMLLALAVVVAVLGLSKANSIRRMVPLLTAGGLFVAALFLPRTVRRWRRQAPAARRPPASGHAGQQPDRSPPDRVAVNVRDAPSRRTFPNRPRSIDGR